jgi:hypothetical protein
MSLHWFCYREDEAVEATQAAEWIAMSCPDECSRSRLRPLCAVMETLTLDAKTY